MLLWGSQSMVLKKKLILASRSPRRLALLSHLGIPFEVLPSNIEEVMDPFCSPEENARLLAIRKAEEVARKARDSFVVGADTIVVLNGEILGKPANADEARRLGTPEYRQAIAEALAEGITTFAWNSGLNRR